MPEFAVTGGIGQQEGFVDLGRWVVAGAVAAAGGWGGDWEGAFDCQWGLGGACWGGAASFELLYCMSGSVRGVTMEGHN